MNYKTNKKYAQPAPAEDGRKFVNVRGELVPVTDEVYYAYYRSKRRDRYYEHDLKTGKPIKDTNGEVVGYTPSREDSLERRLAQFVDFVDEDADVEGEVMRSFTRKEVRKAVASLKESERKLIYGLFFSNDGEGMTVREYAAFSGVPTMTVQDRKIRAFGKLKKILKNL